MGSVSSDVGSEKSSNHNSGTDTGTDSGTDTDKSDSSTDDDSRRRKRSRQKEKEKEKNRKEDKKHRDKKKNNVPVIPVLLPPEETMSASNGIQSPMPARDEKENGSHSKMNGKKSTPQQADILSFGGSSNQNK